MFFKQPLSPNLMFVFFVLAVIGGVIGGILGYRNDVQLQNAPICQFNSYENVVLLDSDEPKDLFKRRFDGL